MSNVTLSKVAINKINDNLVTQSGRVEHGAADAALVASVKRKGVTTPVMLIANDDGTFSLIDGRRRFGAAGAAGISEIPALVYEGLDANEIDSMVLRANEGRAETFARDVYAGILAIQAKNPKIKGKALAAEIGMTPQGLDRYLRYGDLTDRLRGLVDSGAVSISAASAAVSTDGSTAAQDLLADQVEAGNVPSGQTARDDRKALRAQAKRELETERLAAAGIVIPPDPAKGPYPALSVAVCSLATPEEAAGISLAEILSYLTGANPETPLGLRKAGERYVRSDAERTQLAEKAKAALVANPVRDAEITARASLLAEKKRAEEAAKVAAKAAAKEAKAAKADA